jgi:hypothetical protein
LAPVEVEALSVVEEDRIRAHWTAVVVVEAEEE